MGADARTARSGEAGARIGWLDCAAGVSGDMLLAALVGAGVPLEVLQRAVDAANPETAELSVETVRRAGLAATRVVVGVGDSTTLRTWAEVRELLAGADLAEPVRAAAVDTFGRLAQAEATVHGTTPDHVHFHEVGALDAIADVVGVCAGLAHLGLEALQCSPVAVGGGTVGAAHGRMPVPVPAVVELLAGVPTRGGPTESEHTTPTGAALLAAHVTGWGPQPIMAVTATGTGAGSRDPAGVPNVVRLLLGNPAGDSVPDPAGDHTDGAGRDRAGAGGDRAGAGADGADGPASAVLLSTNVDDLDPRLWPRVLERLLDVGASDAWLTPILMKKGRPAHTLSVLLAAEARPAVLAVLFAETSTLGLREQVVGKVGLERDEDTVEVAGQRVRVKVARHGGVVVNVQPEYEDVTAAARTLGQPVKAVLAQAVSAAAALWQLDSGSE